MPVWREQIAVKLPGMCSTWRALKKWKPASFWWRFEIADPKIKGLLEGGEAGPDSGTGVAQHLNKLN